MNSPNILIIFPDDHASHSPTLLNLVSLLLSSGAYVSVICLDSGSHNNKSLDPEIFKLVKTRSLWTAWARLLCKINIITPYRLTKLLLLFLNVKILNLKKTYDEVIGVDSAGGWIAQSIFKEFHFLSLEIEKDWLFLHIKPANIKSIIIQSQDRLDYLFSSAQQSKQPVFFLPNSPRHSNFNFRKPDYSGKLLYLGSIIPSHGIIPLVEVLKLDKTLTLTLKGAFNRSLKAKIEIDYANLISEERLVLDDSYEPQEKVVSYISKHDIGLCFYDFKLIGENNYNYITSPSGKMFNYYSAGLPVIGIDIPGLSSVAHFNAGKLISVGNFSPEEILKSVREVEADYSNFAKNSIEAGKYFNFDAHSTPAKDFLLGPYRGR